ncbi:MAG TPA: preprotein translocase subunit SecA [Candidatus Paceibacterota bacterium]
MFLSRIFHDRIINKLRQEAKLINELETKFSSLSVAQLAKETAKLKEKIQKGEVSPDDVLPEAFALAREAAKRTLGLRHYDVQLMGGIVLHQGKIAEMKTGEGKTLVATLPTYFNALSDKGVHIVTVNDYLAQRDAVWMGQVYHALGLSVGCIVHDAAYLYDPSYTQEIQNDNAKFKINETDKDAERDTLGSFKVFHEYLRPCSRREAYLADITYGTNNEFGFDYLRDNLASDSKDEVQRGHYFAVVDEVDSILIDEARTPLIISMPDEESDKLYSQFARIIPRLVENEDYNIDEKMRAATLTEGGIAKIESILGVENIYDTTISGASGIRYLRHLEQALRAQTLFKKDKDYIVKNGEVVIVDEFTGRLMPGRRYSEGLHQAIEAKEGVAVRKESRTLASITFQNYFRMYEKLSGMTGTAATSAEEFSKVYKLEVVAMPPNKPNVRQDLSDAVYKTERGKFQAVADEIKRRHEAGQPVLVGTVSIAKNEHLSALLKRDGIRHELLNAKNHEREAEIIAQAGRLGAVTVATNMAGRGVDIILGGNPSDEEEAKKVRELGGLFVIGTERHEARRIDNQLRGRAGRQGDPGATRFFVSLDDDLMRVFGGEKIKNMMSALGVPEDQPIQNSIISKSIESAQTKIEGHHFDSRKHVLEYDEVLNKHREVVYKLRKQILRAESAEDKIFEIVGDYFRAVVEAHTAGDHADDWNIKEIMEEAASVFNLAPETQEQIAAIQKKEASPDEKRSELESLFEELAERAYEDKEKEFGKEDFNQIVKMIFLRNIDTLWMDHLENMEYMRDSVGLRAYGQQDPLVEYKNEGHRMFKEMLEAINHNVSATIFKIGARTVSISAPPTSKPAAIGHAADKSIGRNDPCPCSSGKKYKRCHGQ